MAELTTLADASERVDYGLTTSAVRGGTGPRFLRITDIDNSHIDWDEVPRCAATPSEAAKYRLLNGDIVVARTGASTGRSQWVQTVEPAVFASYLVRFRIKPQHDSRFVSYVLQSTPWSDYVAGLAHGKSAQPNMNASDMGAFAFKAPPLPEQRAIAEVLGALDDKIAANTRAEWLADDLIRQMHARAVAAPGSGNERLLEAFTFSFGEPFSGEQFSEPGVGRPLIRIRDLRTFESQVWTTESRTRETVVRPGEIVVGMDAEFRATAWLGEPGLLNQRVCRVTSRVAGAAFVREALREPLAEIEGYKSGTTVIHLNKGDLDRHTVVIPSAPALQAFEATAEPVFARRVASAAERRGLAAIRDTLLPALMSGKLRVGDAERLAVAHT